VKRRRRRRRRRRDEDMLSLTVCLSSFRKLCAGL
jgi:hypothetical protein